MSATKADRKLPQAFFPSRSQDMNPRAEDKTTNQINLLLEIRSANGSSMEFQEADAERVDDALRFLAAPRLFAQPHLLLASQYCASMLPCKGIDMILARTAAPLPITFPLNLPAGQFDIVEQRDVWPDNESAASEDQDGQPGQRRRNSQLEIHTLGGWTLMLEAVTIFHGNVQDERQFFSQLPNMPTIPFRLEKGGFGLINTANIVQVSAWPKPATLPGIALPLACADGFQRADSTAAWNLLHR
jgi:hypothetical protein